MHDHIIGIIVIVAIVAITIFAIYNTISSDKEEKLSLIDARNRERMALIDKGMDPSLADNKKFTKPPYNALMWGLLLSGFSLGLFIGYLLVQQFGGNMNLVVHAMGMFCGGIGLLIYYAIRRKNDAK